MRRQPVDIARMRAIAALPREGSTTRQCRRCFIAHDGQATMTQLREWAYPREPRKHWHYWSVYRALMRLNAKRIGWGVYAARPWHDE
jgi:hypothetical protein